MTAYQIALYIHLLALVAASATSSVVHLAEARSRRAMSVAETRQWLALGGATARFFPMATLALFATGAFMVSVNGPWGWGAGWVDAGIVGVVYLMLSGPVLGARGARIGRALAGLGAGELERARAVVHDPIKGALSWANTGVALGVVFAMAVKPSLLASLAAVTAGAAAGLATHFARERRTVSAPTAERARTGIAA